MRSADNAAEVKISNPDKLFWPEDKYAKQDLADFYRDIFPLLRPYVEDRILTLERCPDGMEGECFYQKQAPKGLPAGTPTKRFQNASGKRKATDYVVGGKLATQLALVNLGCIPVHVASFRAKNYPKADWVCFDIDPSSGKFADAACVALLVREALDKIGLRSFPKTSGSRGVHVFVPLRLGPSADEVLKFAEQFSARLAHDNPKQVTVERGARRPRVFGPVSQWPVANGCQPIFGAQKASRARVHAFGMVGSIGKT